MISSTESVNPRTVHIDQMDIPGILKTINAEDRSVADAVASVIPEIARLAETALAGIRAGGRLIYAGAGTSGRIAVQDAAECPPTYGVPPETLCAVMAGGNTAFTRPVEALEDNFSAGEAAILEKNPGPRDTVVGISANGSAPFVCGVLAAARRAGAATAAILCNETGAITRDAETVVRLPTGPEVITGSTRMKAGTAQKMTLNMLSTAVMIRLGRVKGNSMTRMKPSNAKLKKRAAAIVASLAECTPETAEKSLEVCAGNIEDAVEAVRRGRIG